MKNKRENKKEDLRKNLIIRTIIYVFIILCLCSTFFFKEKIENLLNYAYNYDAPKTDIDYDGLLIHFVDVGQADSTIIQFPTGEIMIIDCGHYHESSLNKFKSYLEKLNFKYKNGQPVIDYLILTHPDADHIGGASYLFQNYQVLNCYLPEIYCSSDDVSEIPNAVVCYNQKYEEIINLLNIEIEVSDCNKFYTTETLSIKSNNFDYNLSENDENMWIVEFFTPIIGAYYTKTELTNEASTNEYSPIMMLTYLDTKVMLTGDVTSEIENEFIAKIENGDYEIFSSNLNTFVNATKEYFDVDILKVAHHGSKYSTTEKFLKVVKPEISIISCGNTHGHPAPETIQRLEESGINPKNIYQTILNGNILIGVTKDGIALNANYIPYIYFEFKLWYFILIGSAISGIIIYFPYIKKYIKIKKR